jgi:hypothetical protein
MTAEAILRKSIRYDRGGKLLEVFFRHGNLSFAPV